MFRKLVQALFSGFNKNKPAPDYEAFIKLRQQAQTDREASLNAVSSDAREMTYSPSTISDKNIALDKLFYDYLFGESLDLGQTDMLTEFVCNKVEALLNRPEHILRNLPALPASVSQVLSLLNDDNFDTNQLLKVIEKEPAMAGVIIQQSNTARYRKTDQEITQLRQAFVTLGSSGVREMVLNQFIKQLSPSENLYYKFFGQKIWNHSYQVANFSQQLAEAQVLPPQNGSAYFVGLFHALGKMVIFQLMVEAFKYVSPDSKPNTSSFKQLVQSHQQQLTIQIANYWQLPKSVISGLDYHTNITEGELNQCLSEATKLSKLNLLYQAGMLDEKEYYDYCRFFRFSDDALDLAEHLIDQN